MGSGKLYEKLLKKARRDVVMEQIPEDPEGKLFKLFHDDWCATLYSNDLFLTGSIFAGLVGVFLFMGVEIILMLAGCKVGPYADPKDTIAVFILSLASVYTIHYVIFYHRIKKEAKHYAILEFLSKRDGRKIEYRPKTIIV